jgi:hypothetical protein
MIDVSTRSFGASMTCLEPQPATERSVATMLAYVFIILSAAALLAALYAIWQSFRALSGSRAVYASLELGSPAHSSLANEKDAVLRSLKDLDFEHAVGKISDEDFRELEATYRARARELLREMDVDIAPYLDRAREAIAAAVDQPDASASLRAPSTASQSNACASCGTSNDVDAKFCKGCGKPLVQSLADEEP